MSARGMALLITLMFGTTLLASGEAKPVTMHFYEVSGAGPGEIRKELDRLGPLDADGIRHDGYTRWYISYAYQLSPDDDGCGVQSFEASLEITMTLPRWDKPKRAPARLVERWERYSAALRLHEDGHRDIAVAAAEEMRQRAMGKRSAVSCQSLGEELNVIAEAVLAECRRQEVKYDEETKHGATQGAQFP